MCLFIKQSKYLGIFNRGPIRNPSFWIRSIYYVGWNPSLCRVDTGSDDILFELWKEGRVVKEGKSEFRMGDMSLQPKKQTNTEGFDQ